MSRYKDYILNFFYISLCMHFGWKCNYFLRFLPLSLFLYSSLGSKLRNWLNFLIKSSTWGLSHAGWEKIAIIWSKNINQFSLVKMLQNFAQSNYGKISDEFRVTQFSNAKLTVATFTIGTFTTPKLNKKQSSQVCIFQQYQ